MLRVNLLPAQQASPTITKYLWLNIVFMPLLVVFGHEAWRRICPISG